jgi:hypothetical protein|tara:strand:+ start:369 stop:602 length:234 start_codon:yes stop_codon:yes gene_type:complete
LAAVEAEVVLLAHLLLQQVNTVADLEAEEHQEILVLQIMVHREITTLEAAAEAAAQAVDVQLNLLKAAAVKEDLELL